MTKEKETKKQRAKDFVKNNKKKCLAALLVVVAGVAYVFFGYDLNTDVIVDKICSLIGGC